MKEKLRIWYNNHKNAIRMTQFVIVSVLLLIIVWLVDLRRLSVDETLPEALLLSVEVSRGFLSTLAGVFLTVTTFTLTTIMTVLTVYNSNYSPRVLQKFIDKPNVLSLIGIFTGGFFYCVLSLFIIQNLDDSRRVLAGTLGIIYAMASMLYFVRFAQIVIRDIRVANLMEDIYNSAKKLVVEQAEERKKSERYAEEEIGRTLEIVASDTGYLYSIDCDGIMDLLGGCRCELVSIKRIGEYVAAGTHIANLNFEHKSDIADGGEDSDLAEKLASCFLMNKFRNESTDYHNDIRNLVEIALRAISPGVNDPNTCINCLGKITDLLAILLGSENNYILLRNEEHARLVYTAYTVDEELYLTYYQLIHYGKSDPSVAYAILESLSLVYMLADDSARDNVRRFSEETYEILTEAMETDMDRRHIKRAYQRLMGEAERRCDAPPTLKRD